MRFRKSGDGKSICAFPDVCMTPPENPATPPRAVPYPNTGMASDTTDGSRSVQISGKEIMLKNKSYFKQSTGDEAGCAAKKGVVTSVNRGKVYFIACWSMDVKAEGENVVRHLDMTTHNHASPTPNTPPIAYADRMALLRVSDCDEELGEIERECTPHAKKAKCPDTRMVDAAVARRDSFPKGSNNRKLANEAVNWVMQQYAAEVRDNPCLTALQCAMVSYKKGRDGACCPPQTPEHLVPASQFGTDRREAPSYLRSGPCTLCLRRGTRIRRMVVSRFRRDYMAEHSIPVNAKGDYTHCWTFADPGEMRRLVSP